MKKINLALLIAINLCLTRAVNAQVCDSLTPVFTVDLSGTPGGTWQSIPVLRGGNCCATDNNCIEFIVTLDSLANGIKFDILSGAMPGGALFFQINCGPLQPVGEIICLTGTGPHIITFCKPGNNLNVYQITSFAQPSVEASQWVTQSCVGELAVQGLIDTSIHWNSIPFNATYNTFLSCPNGCDTTSVIPSGILPPYVNYEVCGYVIGGCVPFYYCDTSRIYFANNLAVYITPQNPVICFGGPNATVTANITGGLPPYQFLWSTGETTASISVGPGTYTVQLTDSMNCLIAIDSVVVTSMSLPISANAGPDQLFCINQGTVTLNGTITAATGGIWGNGTGIFSPNDSALNASYTPSSFEINVGIAQLTLITTGNNTCPADTDLIQIIISPNPVPVINGNTTVCEFSTENYSTSANPGSTYNWNISGGNIVNNSGNAITVQWMASGTGSISLTVTNAAGCDSTHTINCIIAPQPVPIITGSTSVCTTDIIQYSVSTINPGNSYSWTVSGGFILGPSNSSSINVQWTTPGNASITLTASNSLGCDSTTSLPVTVFTIPAPLITGNSTVCENQTFTYSTPGVPGNTYIWNVNNGNILVTNNNVITVQWPLAGIGTLSVIESNTLICDSTVSLNIVINPRPLPNINGAGITCTNTFNQYNISSPVPGEIYNWSVTNGTMIGTASGNSIHVLWSNSGNGMVYVHALNSLGCDTTVSMQVTVLQKPHPNIAGAIAVCELDTGVYQVTNIPGDSYQWQVTGGSIVSYNSPNCISVVWFQPDTGEVFVTQISPNGCDSSTSLKVRINVKPVPIILGPPEFCEQEIITFSTPVINGITCSWSVNNNGIISGSTLSNILNVSWNSPGNNTINLTQTTVAGCSESISLQAVALQKPYPLITGNNVGCISNMNGYYSSNQEPNVLYQWTVSGASIISGNGTNNIEVKWLLPGLQNITLVATNISTGCDSTVSINVLVDSLASPVINTPVLSSCTPVNISFNNNSLNSNYNYLWSFGDGTFSNAPNPLHQYNSPGNYAVQLIATNNTGCADTVNSNVIAFPIPEADFSMSFGGQTYYLELSTLALNNLSTGATNYQWNFGNGDTSTFFEPQYQYTSPGNYSVTLTAINQWLCSSTVVREIIVKVPEDIIIPNAFTPNADNTNDYFSAAGLNITELEISIFNRWGALIYASSEPEFSWDGTRYGNPVQEGIYVYLLSAKGFHGKIFERKGTVSVIR